MNDNKNFMKIAGIVVVIAIALGFLVFNVVKTSAPGKEEVVGTLDMDDAGGRDAEKGATGMQGQETGTVVDESKR